MNLDVNDIIKEFDEGGGGQLGKHSHGKDEVSKGFGLSSPGSSKNLYEKLTIAMLNERMAPDILPFQHEVLNEVLGQLSHQQQYLLDSHEYGDINLGTGVIDGDFKLQLMIIETDIERISYLARLYMRTRLSKIDNFTIHYINETATDGDNKKKLLSREETEYMHNHFKILTNLYNQCFLKKLPQFLTLLDDTSGGQSMISTPDLNQPVFIKVVTKIPIVLHLGDDEDLELVEDGIYVVKYSLVKRYVEIGDIELI